MLIINDPKAPPLFFFSAQFVLQTEAGICYSTRCLSTARSQEAPKFRLHCIYCISGRTRLNTTKIYTRVGRSAWICQNGKLPSERHLCASILSTICQVFENFALLGSRRQLGEKKYERLLVRSRLKYSLELVC